METNNIPKGTLQITVTNCIQYLAMGLFYIIVTKTNALTQTDIGILSSLSFLSSTFLLITTLALLNLAEPKEKTISSPGSNKSHLWTSTYQQATTRSKHKSSESVSQTKETSKTRPVQNWHR